MSAADWNAVEQIYAEGIATGDATFEQATPTWAQWDGSHLATHRLIAVPGALAGDAMDARVFGWAACSPVSDRCVYAGVAEVSVYVSAAARGRGVGSALLRALVTSTETAGLWTLQAGIFPENTASVALHERAGFRVVGRRERIGRMNGVWRDVLLMERRSAVAQPH